MENILFSTENKDNNRQGEVELYGPTTSYLKS